MSSRGQHLGQIGQQFTVSGLVRTATRVKGFAPNSPDRRLLVIETGDVLVKLVTDARWASRVERGDPITVAGIVKAHTEWRGRHQTVLTRVRRAEPVPDLTDANRRWEAVNPAEARPRPFPRTPHALAPAAPTRPQRC